MSAEQSPHGLGRMAIDAAFCAFVLGNAVGSYFHRLPCQGRRLQTIVEEFGGAGWGCLELPPPHDALLVLSEQWPHDTRRAYLEVASWYEQIPDRVEKSELYGEFAVLLRGGRGTASVERMGVFEDQRRVE